MHRLFAGFLCFLLGVCTTPAALAQAPAPASSNMAPRSATTAPTVRPAAPVPAVAPRSDWHNLTPDQQQALAPLAEKWQELNADRKRKWLEISRNFHSLSPAEQSKMHNRMSEWVSLSQQQRTQARLNFAETKKLSPDEKAANWQAYQALSQEEKKRLAAKGPAKPAGVAVVKPTVSPEKITKVPVTRHTPKPARAAAQPAPVDANTLLPQPAP